MLRHLRFFMVEQLQSRLGRITSTWFLFIWSEKTFPVLRIYAVLKKSQEKSCLPNYFIINIPQGYWRNTLACNICHWVDIYRLCKTSDLSWLISFSPSLTTMRFPHSSSMITSLGESSKFIQSSTSSTTTFFFSEEF